MWCSCRCVQAGALLVIAAAVGVDDKAELCLGGLDKLG
jgi:hypothetical protein